MKKKIFEKYSWHIKYSLSPNLNYIKFVNIKRFVIKNYFEKKYKIKNNNILIYKTI